MIWTCRRGRSNSCVDKLTQTQESEQILTIELEEVA